MVDYQKSQEAIAKAKQEEFINAKPSQQIRMAIEDLKKCHVNPNFYWSMQDWCALTADETGCAVCVAGAVMAMRFDGMERARRSEYKGLSPAVFEDHRLRLAFSFLDHVRAGMLQAAAAHAHIPLNLVQKLGPDRGHMHTGSFNAKFDLCIAELETRAIMFESIGY